MPEAHFAPVGHFCWPELATTDLAAAKATYGSWFGWSVYDVPPIMGNYSIFQVDGLDVAAGYQMEAQQTAPPHWNSYVSVTSVDESCARAETLGAHLLMAPFDIPNVGRMAFIRDPGGASLALWQSGGHHGAGLFDQPGALCWTELATRDSAQAEVFYTALFGWKAITSNDSGMAYTHFHAGDAAVGGMMAMEGPQWDGIPSHWLPYIAVAAVDAVASRVPERGGTLLVPPTDIPVVGRFAVAKDAQGAVISFITLAAR